MSMSILSIPEIQNELKALIERKHRLDFFENHEHKEQLKSIIDSSRNQVEKTLKSLLKLGIDGIKYLNSIEGQIYANEILGAQQLSEEKRMRCERCRNFQYNDDIDFNECKIHGDLMMICEFFDDTGFDFIERIEKSTIRCSECEHFIQDPNFIQNPELKDIDVQMCSLKLDLFAEYCPSLTFKKQGEHE